MITVEQDDPNWIAWPIGTSKWDNYHQMGEVLSNAMITIEQDDPFKWDNYHATGEVPSNAMIPMEQDDPNWIAWPSPHGSNGAEKDRFHIEPESITSQKPETPRSK
ncbi:hypothetical protein MMC17_004625 [Xylographa soralifera]|nr:hypothetical protein [Xylographa soralifera]